MSFVQRPQITHTPSLQTLRPKGEKQQVMLPDEHGILHLHHLRAEMVAQINTIVKAEEMMEAMTATPAAPQHSVSFRSIPSTLSLYSSSTSIVSHGSHASQDSER